MEQRQALGLAPAHDALRFQAGLAALPHHQPPCLPTDLYCSCTPFLAGRYGMLCVMIAAAFWDIFSCTLELQVSTTHTTGESQGPG